MEKRKLERYLVAALFVLVLVVFSLAERDSKKLRKLYTGEVAASPMYPAPPPQAASTK